MIQAQVIIWSCDLEDGVMAAKNSALYHKTKFFIVI